MEVYSKQITLLNTKDLLLHLMYKTEYFKKINSVYRHFVNYLGEGTSHAIALFLYEPNNKVFHFNYATETDLSNGLKNCYCSVEQMDHLINKDRYAMAVPLHDLFSEAAINLWEDHETQTYHLIPLRGQSSYLAFLLLEASPDDSKDDMLFLLTIIEDISKLLAEIQTYIHIINNGKRYKQLFSVTTKFHSSMDQEEILEEVVHAIVRLFPECAVKLVVSDNGLEPLREEPLAMEAFLKGELRVNREASGSTSIYAPLKGRQGVYGVFMIKTPVDMKCEEDELSFVKLQATTAGHALENAKLYQQSQRSISDLQLINQASEKMNRQLRMSETIPYLIQQIMQSFEAEEVGFFTLTHDQNWEVYEASTCFFQCSDSQSFVKHLFEHLKSKGESLFLGDLLGEGNWGEIPFRSLMAIPLKQDEAIIGFVIALHQNPYHFTFDGFKVMQALIHHSTLALINARLREELEKLVITDPLTKLYNRTYLNEKIQQSFLEDQSGVLLLMDIDNFKQINDNFGHLAGDQVLIQVAQLITKSTRKADIAARWGGEELAVYFPNLTVEESYVIASRILNKVERETTPSVTISCGLSEWQKETLRKTNDQLFSQADKALYAAKNSGKNRIERN